MGKKEAEVLSIEGHDVQVTHPDKLYFSRQTKLTKLDLVRYYLSVAPGALAGIQDRPIVLKRYVNGAEGEAFYQKRAPALASSKWWKEERHGVFLDYNQNAKDRTTCSAYSVRPLLDARVSTPLHWHEVPDCEPADFTVLTIPKRFAELGDPHLGMDATHGSLEGLLELAAKDEAAGFGDAPWPPHFRKMEGEAPRVAPSRAKSAAKPPRTKMPLVVVANSPDKEAALAGLERWKGKYPEVARFLAKNDVLVDSMRGRSSTWTRIRVNLRHVPEALRPPQETPDPDDDPTREWREWHKKRAAKKDQ